MKGVSIGYVPLLDAAPLIIAREMGFAAEEGIALDLRPAASWSQMRDMLVFGVVDAAHMLAPVPVASALSVGGRAQVPICAGAVLSVNGTVIGVSEPIARALRGFGYRFDFADATAARDALLATATAPLRIGVPFPTSMHHLLITYWLGSQAASAVSVRTVPPSRMAAAIARDEIDAFCVGEPWGSLAVEHTAGALLLPGRAIWSCAPEKVLALRTDWGDTHGDLRDALIRSVVKAGRWLADPLSATIAAEILSSETYLDLPAELLDRGLTGHLVISSQGEHRRVPGFLNFYQGAASFPWRSQAEWIGSQLAQRLGLDGPDARRRAAAVFRSDWYRSALDGTGMDVPGASSKIEGGNSAEMPVASALGRLTLAPNLFFDRRIFDPDLQN